MKDELADVFKLAKDKVIVHAEFTGGGFGSKFGAGDYGVFAAKLAKKAGKPVLMALDRKEESLAAGNRPDSWNRVKLGYRKDGTVTAVEYESFGTAGVATGTGTGGFVKSAYGFPAVAVAESDVFTHLGPGCAMRAPGHPQGCFAVETALEEREQVLARHAPHALGLLEREAELALEDAVEALDLLLLTELDAVPEDLGAALAVLAGRKVAALDGALVGEAAVPREEQLHSFAPAQPANRFAITSHGKSGLRRFRHLSSVLLPGPESRARFTDVSALRPAGACAGGSRCAGWA